MRIVTFFFIFMCYALAMASNAASELVDMALCKSTDFTLGQRWCSEGTCLRGDDVVVQHDQLDSMYLFTKIDSNQDMEVVHVWFFDHKLAGSSPSYYVQGRGYQESPDPVVKQLGLSPAEASSMVSAVKLFVQPSPGWRTRSSMAIGRWAKGSWEVRVYDENGEVLGSSSFVVE